MLLQWFVWHTACTEINVVSERIKFKRKKELGKRKKKERTKKNNKNIPSIQQDPLHGQHQSTCPQNFFVPFIKIQKEITHNEI